MAETTAPTIEEIKERVAPAPIRDSIHRLSSEGGPKLKPTVTVDHSKVDMDAAQQAIAHEKTEAIRDQLAGFDAKNLKHCETDDKVILPTKEDLELARAVERKEKISQDIPQFNRDSLKHAETKISENIVQAE